VQDPRAPGGKVIFRSILQSVEIRAIDNNERGSIGREFSASVRSLKTVTQPYLGLPQTKLSAASVLPVRL